ncbi:DALR anticodon-binding domain-containing protein 3-like isoform X1 [Epargyreus clarus]|uniref:DALR anticodon-binding domain-containing protein 3-like isoform X1 n=1 Tax=Epargyreus clarus TaxID=520877 RepID=UPI003C2E0A66
MFRDELRQFVKNVYQFLIGNDGPSGSGLIVKHMGTQEKDGDYSFPNTIKPWWEHLIIKEGKSTECTFLQYINKDVQTLVSESKYWDISIARAMVVGDRVHLFLNRASAILIGLLNAIETHHMIAQCFTIKPSSVELDPLCDHSRDVTSMRVKRLAKVIENLYAISAKCREWSPQIFVTTKSTSKKADSRVIYCGPVLNAKTGVKETSVSGDELISMRQTDLQLIFEHKMGGRIPANSPWSEYMLVVGESSVSYELLRTKPSSPVNIEFTPLKSANKEATFILYNGARLQKLLSYYNLSPTFPPLPDFEDADFTLLTHEDEWNLVFNFILGLPWVLNTVVQIDDKTCVFRPHSICIFVSAMVKAFSKYYRNVKILTAPRPHLLPVLFARIYMLKILNDCLKFCLKLLNIKTVREM